MLICISIHADTGTLYFRPIILKRVNSSELVIQIIVYLVKGRQMLQEYLLKWYEIIHNFPSVVVFVVSEAYLPLATCKVLGYLIQI